MPPAQAQLVWSNMSLHWAQDAPTLMREWQRALVVDGFLMFTTLGPGTLVALRDLYRAHGWGTPVCAVDATCTTSATCWSRPASPTR